MNEIEIFQSELRHLQNCVCKLAVLRCKTSVSQPALFLDTAVSSYVEYESYNEFVDIDSGNPWIRVILSGVNELDYQEWRPDLEIFKKDIQGSGSIQNCRIAVMRGGTASETPLEFMNEAALEYAGDEAHNQFIETHMDNPWVRVVLTGINRLKFEAFSDQKLK